MLRPFALWPAVLGRHNFVNLAEQGSYNDFTNQKHFGRPFDWLAFNLELVKQQLGSNLIIAFGPLLLVSKNGKHTAGTDYFHSGVVGRRKWGLEHSGIAAVDLDDKSAYLSSIIKELLSGKLKLITRAYR